MLLSSLGYHVRAAHVQIDHRAHLTQPPGCPVMTALSSLDLAPPETPGQAAARGPGHHGLGLLRHIAALGMPSDPTLLAPVLQIPPYERAGGPDLPGDIPGCARHGSGADLLQHRPPTPLHRVLLVGFRGKRWER